MPSKTQLSDAARADIKQASIKIEQATQAMNETSKLLQKVLTDTPQSQGMPQSAEADPNSPIYKAMQASNDGAESALKAAEAGVRAAIEAAEQHILKAVQQFPKSGQAAPPDPEKK